MLVEFELLRKAQRGDTGAFNQVVSTYRRRIPRTISPARQATTKSATSSGRSVPPTPIVDITAACGEP